MARRVKYDWFYDDDNVVYGDDNTVNWELRGYDGVDRLFGADGGDLLKGGDGNDFLWGDRGDDILEGGAGNDTLWIDRGDNHYDGGSGYDTVVFNKVTTSSSWGSWSHYVEEFQVGFSVDIRTGETRAQTMTANGPSTGYTDVWGTNSFENIQAIAMTNQNDVVRDNNGGHTIHGRGGNDVIEGRGGGDTIDGGEGRDTASYAGSAESVFIDLSAGTASGGDAEGDTLISIENLTGSGHHDVLWGNGSANRLEGGGDFDELTGAGGADILVGGSGIDNFYYDALSDSTVALSGRDSILDFQVGSDNIVLEFIDAVQGGGNDAFRFIGTQGFGGSAGQLRYVAVEDAAGVEFNRVEGDVNGDARADFAIAVYTNGAALTAGDFFL
jgi:Ca2+-binding RTX toxin-like protein